MSRSELVAEVVAALVEVAVRSRLASAVVTARLSLAAVAAVAVVTVGAASAAALAGLEQSKHLVSEDAPRPRR